MTQNKPAAWIITRPKADIGRRTALALAAHGTVVSDPGFRDRVVRETRTLLATQQGLAHETAS